MAAEDSLAADLARYYDLDTRHELDDVGLYLALARRLDGPVLELAAGTGRIAVPLAAAGHAVIGLDNDAQMLERARRAWAAASASASKGGALDFVVGDLTQADLGRRFGLVILGFNGLLLLGGRDRQQAALEAMARHLSPGGRAVVDIWLPAPEDLAIYDGRLVLDWVRHDDATGNKVIKFSSARHDTATATAHLTTIFDEWPADGSVRRIAREDELHLLGAHELLDLVSRAGLAIEAVGGDHELGAFGPGSERMVVVSGLL
ncbi:class I SAM-dependent methyltransferase [soil metagenome]